MNGKYGNAISFDGAGDYAVTANSAAYSFASTQTISFWMYRRSQPFTYSGPLEYKNGGGDGWIFYCITALCNFKISDTVTTRDSYGGSTNNILSNTWYHFVFVYDPSSNTFKRYVNGALKQTVDTTVTTMPNMSSYNSSLKVGRSGNSLTDFDGLVDDVRVYNRALSALEIAALYNSGGAVIRGAPLVPSNPLAGSLTASWSFDSSTVSGSNVADQSGNGHTLTLQNSASITAGHSGQALTLNGVNQYAVGFIGSLPTSVSLSMWVKANSVASTQSVLVEQDSTTPNSGYHFTLVGIRNGAFYAGFWDIGDIASTPITAGTWYHVILTYDGVAHTQSLYVDDVLQGTQNGTWSPPAQIYFLPGLQQHNCSFTNTSGHCSDLAAYFNGQIDDLQAYDQAFSQSDVNDLSSGLKTTVNASSASLTADGSLSSGLVGLWTFDGPDVTDKVYDRSGQGNNGYLNSGTATSSIKAIGKLGQGINFNGTTNYMLVPNNATLNLTTQYTFSAWVKPSKLINGTNGNILARQDYGNKLGYRFLLAGNGGCANKNCLLVSAGDGTNRTEFGSGIAAGQIDTVGRWYHVAGIFSPGSLSLYVDGALIGTGSTAVTSISNTSDNLNIGRHNTGSEPFPGSIDDVRIYNRALSAAEIKQLYLLGQ